MTCHECFDFKDRLWLIIDLREGNLCDLIEDMQQEPSYTENAIKYIAHQTLSGLYFLHSQNVIHRDIKSDNVLFSQQGSV